MLLKLLVIDDDTDLLESLVVLLEYSGYIVSGIQSPAGLSDIIAGFQPNIIIMDIVLKGFDGREICRELKANPLTSGIKVILISAMHGGMNLLHEYGADATVMKPFLIDELLRNIKQLQLK